LTKIILLCFLFLSGCATTKQEMFSLPHSPYSWQLKSSTTTAPDKRRVSQSIMIFYRLWKSKFGDRRNEVARSLDNLMIEWSSKKKILLNAGRDNQGRLIREGIVTGMTLGPTYIWLHANQYERVFATSLIHELVHVALWSQGCRNGDPDHEGSIYACWTKEHTKFINYLNKELAELDI
jgi:hypothetical protein